VRADYEGKTKRDAMTPAGKIMLLGPIGVGKTSLVRRLVFDRFDSDYKTTIGVDIMSHEVSLPQGGSARLVIWDTDGDFGQSILTSAYAAGASGALVVGDVTRPQTITRVRGLLEGFARLLPECPAFAVFNKIDLAATPAVESLGFAGVRVMAASAQTGEGVRDAFASLAARIFEPRP
jgi:small GTP-binding protein